MTDWADDLIKDPPKRDPGLEAPSPVTNQTEGPGWAQYLKHKTGMVAEALGSGLADLAGLPGDLDSLVGWGMGKVLGPPPKGSPEPLMAQANSRNIKNALGLGTYAPATPDDAPNWNTAMAGVEALPSAALGVGMGMEVPVALKGCPGVGGTRSTSAAKP